MCVYIYITFIHIYTHIYVYITNMWRTESPNTSKGATHIHVRAYGHSACIFT